MRNKRKEGRKSEENVVNLFLLSEFDEKPDESKLHALTRDISIGGAKIQVDFDIPVGTRLKMELLSTKIDRRITVFGEVKWVKDLIEGKAFEAGVEFVDTAPEEILDLLNHFYKKKK